MKRCQWCVRPLQDKRRSYCDAHCQDYWRHYASSASETAEQADARIRAHLTAAADKAMQDGNAELLVKIRRELRQLWPSQITAQHVEADDPLAVFD